MVTYIPFPGTWDWEPGDAFRWWQTRSKFEEQMNLEGFQSHGLEYPFWGTVVAGTWVTDRSLRAWYHGAHVAVDYILRKRIPVKNRNLLAWSHGGQVAYIVGTMIPVNTIVDVGTPVRADMEWAYKDARAKNGKLHVYSTGWENRMQFFGGLMDRKIRWKWDNPHTENMKIEGTGHGDVFTKPRVDILKQFGVLDFIEGDKHE